MGQWARRWSRTGDRTMRRADAELESDEFGAACRSYVTAAEYYWLALSDRTLQQSDRRALQDAQVSAFQAAVPMLAHPTTRFELRVRGLAVAGYLSLPAGSTTTVPVVLWRVQPPATPEAGYRQVAVPVLDAGCGCALVGTGSARKTPASVTGAVTRWIRRQPGVSAVIDPVLGTDVPPQRRS
jgi:hypothetical protein